MESGFQVDANPQAGPTGCSCGVSFALNPGSSMGVATTANADGVVKPSKRDEDTKRSQMADKDDDL